MRILVCGSRMFALDGDGRKIVRDRLDVILDYHGVEVKDLQLVVGGANGPDEWAREWAVQTSINHSVFYAQWEAYGRRAGIIRNLDMLDTEPDLVIAFWDGNSLGTAHTIGEARARGIPVEVVDG